MRCSKCSSDNPDGARFCIECGIALSHKCAGCGYENLARAKYCVDCGAPLEAASAPPAAAVVGPPETAYGERRHLTVLFCDLVNSTEIAARLDPEEWRDIAARYQRTAAEAVTRLGGHVAKYLGDGLVVFFGWPEAHEDDGERAVRAGIAAIDAVAALNERVSGIQNVKLAARVGIDAGSVVVGHGGGKEADVFGDAPNIAARAQAAAPPNSVFITAAVHQLVSGLFVVEDCGAQPLKGVDRPVQLYRAIRPTVVRRRTHGAAARALTPFVGREDELRIALSRWERAREGKGQLVLVIGEPGLGKSRLVEEFRARIKDEPHLWVECAGEQLFANTPFFAVTRMLDQGLGWRGDESEENKVTLLENALGQAGLKLDEALPLIAELLNLPIPEKYPPLMFPPERKRKRLLAALAGWVLGAARGQPVLMAMEDLHWVDPSTLELQRMLVERSATAPLMLLYTARPEFRAPWPMRAHHAQITLSRLNNRQTREMVAGVAARSALSKDVIDAVVRRTDGVPLFVEELTRLMLEGDGRSVARGIPATLRDSLTARLDRLGTAREVAQLAAVLGREFSYELLRAVSPTPENELQAALGKLADAELIYARGVPPETQYRFKHALIQDAAYEVVLKSRRKELHRRVAQTIVEKFPALADTRPEVLARHWTDAGEAEPAIAAWKKAGEVAEARRAFKETEEAYRKALAMLSSLPETPARDARELELVSALFWVLAMTSGWTARETVEVTTRARALAEQSGSLGQLVQQLFVQWTSVFVSGDLPGAIAAADQMLDFARRGDDPTSRAFAHSAQVMSRFYRGDFIGADEHFARFGALLETAPLKLFPSNVVNTSAYASLIAWILGHPDQARARMARAIAFARDTQNPTDLAFARYFEGWLYWLLGEPRLSEAATEQALKLCEEHGFTYLRHLTRSVLGWSKARAGRTSEGIALIRDGLSGVASIGARIGIRNLLTSLAEAQAHDGAIGDALNTLEDALRENPEEAVFQPNILKVRAELRLKLGQSELAEADYREAIALAQKMGAKAFELQATMGLARMRQARGARAAARDLLAPVYNWFTEGFETPDLKDAKALLDQLTE